MTLRIPRSRMAAFLLLAGGAIAHDQPPSTVEIVVASDRTASVVVTVQLATTLWHVMSPQLSLGDFATRYANLPDGKLALAYQGMQDSFALQSRLLADGEAAVKLSAILWPDVASVRGALQEILPAALYESDQSEIVFRMWTIRAQAKIPAKAKALDLRLPRGFEPTTASVVWPEPDSSSTRKSGKH